MSQALIIRPEAEADLADAYDWYEERVAGLGAEFLDRVEIVLGAIAEHPELYPTIFRNVRRALTRRFPIKCSATYSGETPVAPWDEGREVPRESWL